MGTSYYWQFKCIACLCFQENCSWHIDEPSCWHMQVMPGGTTRECLYSYHHRISMRILRVEYSGRENGMVKAFKERGVGYIKWLSLLAKRHVSLLVSTDEYGALIGPVVYCIAQVEGMDHFLVLVLWLWNIVEATDTKEQARNLTRMEQHAIFRMTCWPRSLDTSNGTAYDGNWKDSTLCGHGVIMDLEAV